jgi:hypothetical protein
MPARKTPKRRKTRASSPPRRGDRQRPDRRGAVEREQPERVAGARQRRGARLARARAAAVELGQHEQPADGERDDLARDEDRVERQVAGEPRADEVRDAVTHRRPDGEQGGSGQAAGSGSAAASLRRLISR